MENDWLHFSQKYIFAAFSLIMLVGIVAILIIIIS